MGSFAFRFEHLTDCRERMKRLHAVGALCAVRAHDGSRVSAVCAEKLSFFYRGTYRFDLQEARRLIKGAPVTQSETMRDRKLSTRRARSRSLGVGDRSPCGFSLTESGGLA